ncbi:MAG: hypothetical protein IKE55_06500 [Kiritimatiellae bacterium]|nr:hypothetical protein [Kiritimatiellia bacterium]
MTHRPSVAVLVLAVAFAAQAAAPSFTAKLQVDLSDVKADEPIYEVGAARLSLRLAGQTGGLETYDRRHGNYLNFPMPDGSCPVIEATLCERGGRVGIPLGALARPDGVHDVTLNFVSPHWTICVDGVQDEDMPPAPDSIAWPTERLEKTLSARVRKATFSSPACANVLPEIPDARHITRPIQYWTPSDPNAWVGDVAVGTFKGRFHVFYLFDRRHHGSGGGAGRHCFAHLSSADLVDWDEHPTAVQIDDWWETVGTGTPFVHNGKLHLAYGLHTSRFTKDPAYPIGGTYAVSPDGIHFVKSRRIVHATQNPTIYNRTDGLLGLVAGYDGMGGFWTSDHIGDWKLYDGKVPASGDCPCPFEWNGHHYLFQGFTKFAYSPTGRPGSFVDWVKAGLAPYEGLSVPMVAPFGENRRIMSGWLEHVYGWGGWLVFRELIQNADGTLGTKWVPEIAPPVSPKAFEVQPGRPFRLVFAPKANDGKSLTFVIDPSARTATFADDVPDVKFEPANRAGNFRISNLPEFTGNYTVRLVQYWCRKSNATIFDVEIGGSRTMICRRAGKFKEASEK